MQELIDDLLTLSRISRIKNPYEEVDMRKLIDDVVDRISYDIKELNVRLDVPQVLPVIKCDRIKMAEVFLNLINNAIKFSSKKKDVRPHVEIGYNKKNRMHEFYVKDNGIGIPRQHQKDIFGIFKRLHKRDEYEGTGAGLSIVKRVIDDHKGEVWVRSEEGKGSTFFFTIPMDIKNIAGYDSGRQV